MADSSLSLLISIGSLIVAATALGWNIYRDVVLKPRVSVSCSVSEIVSPGHGKLRSVIDIRCVNFGPGDVVLKSIVGQDTSLFKRLMKKRKQFIAMHDGSDPYSGSLPTKLPIGDTVELLLPYNSGCFLVEDFTRLGVVDSFGRTHWVPRSDLRRAVDQYKADFGGKSA